MYCTVLDVVRHLSLETLSEESFDSVSSGDTIELANDNLIKDGMLPEENSDISDTRTVILSVDGNVQDESDYTVYDKNGEIEYTGSDSGSATAQYRHTVVASSSIEDKIESAQDEIDKETGTTFESTESVIDIYDGQGCSSKDYIFRGQPVFDVDTVEVNQASLGSEDDWEEMTEGRSKDYITLPYGIRFTSSTVAPSEEPANLRVTYSYGYDEVPADVENVCTMMAAHKMLKNTVVSSNVEGKDNFDPETTDTLKRDIGEIINRYKVEKFGLEATLSSRESN